MRPATAADIPAVETMILARSAWLEDRGLPSWRKSAADLAGQSANPGGDVWVLADDDAGRIIGFIAVQDQTPPWGWTDRELAEPAHYLYSSVTDPAYRQYKPGTAMGLWAVDRAAAVGKTWVRRGCNFSELVAYNESQGFKLVHEVRRTNSRVYLMARNAEPVKDLHERFAVLPG
ncbi:GNAT family N-acetyltransferase [Streptomyces sp. URMC 127]|uniref:GNAT family N-acetyltransferase n=1 Tax=Streptomyces sp. URMC 127 TaxID=3423402 RepID=UPI003F1A1150